MYLVESDEPFIDLVAISDVHAGHRNHAGKNFLNTIDYIKNGNKRKKRVFWGYGGDGVEHVTPDKGGAQLADQTIQPTQQYEYLLGLLKPISESLAYMIPGNHEWRAMKNASVNTTQIMAHGLERIDAFKGAGGMFLIRVGSNVYYYTVFHGFLYSLVNTFSEHDRRRKIYPKSDVIVLGHTHSLCYVEKVYIDLDENGRPCARPYYYVRSGTYLKYPSYAQERAMEPGRIGSPIIRFFGNERKIEIDDRTLAAI